MRISLSIALGAMIAVLFAGCGKEENLKRHIVLYPNSKNFKEEWTIKTLPNGDTLMHGVNKEYFWNGSTKKSVVWKEGKRDGSAQAWYDNGANKWQKSYDNGKKVSTWRLFYSDGHPWIVAPYQNDALNGKVQVWDKADLDKPKEAEYKDGSCVSGDCGLLDPKKAAEDAAPADKTQVQRDNESLAEFLD
jgi:antitoxin component YwqK of YwqJK toxin-antitoxin module